MKLLDNHVALARARHFRPDSVLGLTGDPEKDLQAVFDFASTYGVEIFFKEPKGRLHRTSMSLRAVWLMGSDFKRRSPINQVALARHEMGHLMGQLRLGTAQWFWQYLWPPNRWAFEISGLAEEYCTYKKYGRVGNPEKTIARLDYMVRRYRFKRLDQDQYRSESIKVLRDEWPSAVPLAA